MRAERNGLPARSAPSRRVRSICARTGRCAVIIAPIVLTACQPAVLDPRGIIGIAEKTILIDSVGIMLAIVGPTIVAIFAFAFWFRASNTRAFHWPDWEYSGRIELVVWSIPALTVGFLGGIAWIGAHDLDPRVPVKSDVPAINVQVVALDWKWLFIYPDQQVASVNRLVVPAGAPLSFRLTSATVMNSFFVPQLGSQIYTMAGMATELNLRADSPGTFAGLSAQFSGDGFSDMRFEVSAVSPEAFAQWVDETHAHGGSLDLEQYADLAMPSSQEPPRAFGAVSAGLFDAIIATPGAPPRALAP